MTGRFHTSRRRWAGALGLVAALAACDPLPPTTPEGLVDYDRDVRPILAEHCFECHGPDAASREADLRLDTFDGATMERPEGPPAIVPGHPDESPLIARVSATSDEERMPPTPRAQLRADQIAILERWIEGGAPYQRHWVFRAPSRPTPPAGGHPVDAFIDARLAAEGIEPAPIAAPAVLLRRLHLDLTGLPPTLEQVEAFAADPSEAAYIAAVDRLLASPAFAEHLTRDWLDYVGYGDSNGTYLDLPREAWPYRDWVLDAFLANRPLDEMIVEQLAGDLLPEATDDQRLATAMLRLHPTTEEEGVDEEYRFRYAADRATLVGTQLLGLTVQCARCHDHRYDPIPQTDFYRLLACFNHVADAPSSVLEQPVLDAMSPIQRRELSRWTSERDARRATLDAIDLTSTIDRLTAVVSTTPTFEALHPTALSATRGSTLTADLDGTVHASGEPPLADTYVMTAPVTGTVRVLRVELGAGRGVPAVLSELAVHVVANGGRRRLEVASASIAGADASSIVDGATETFVRLTEPSVVDLVLASPLVADGESIELRIDQLAGVTALFARARVLVSADEVATLSEPARAALLRAPSERSEEQIQLIRRHAARIHEDGEVRRELSALAEAERRVERLSVVPRTRVFVDDEPTRRTHVLDRGDFAAPMREVSCGAPLALTLDGAPEITDRLGLARWIVGPTSPTPWRVLANHYVQLVLARELLVTDGTTDFGTRAGAPSHPELLDWLAVQLREHPDVRAFVRLLVTSTAYRRAAASGDDRLFAHAARRRLDAEVIRDQALAVSGLLVHELGGPSVRPYHPDGIYEAVGRGGGPLPVYRPDRAPARVHRRSLYTFWRRANLLPSMALLDAPSRTAPISRRIETSTPTQALALLNEPLLVEAAEALADAMPSEGRDVDAQLRWVFSRVTLRRPNDDELVLLRASYDEELALGDVPAPVHVGEIDRPPSSDVAAARARLVVARIVLNLSETVSRE